MNRKAGFYAVIGGMVGAVLTMAVCSVMPIGAQNGNATFGEITCTGLKVVDEAGIAGIQLSTGADRYSGVTIYGSEIGTFSTLTGGGIVVSGTAGIISLLPRSVMVSDGESSVELQAADDTGRIRVAGKSGNVWLSTDENGGSVKLTSSDSTRAAYMDIDEHGGSFTVYGKGSNKSRAIIRVNEYGNGAVSTWDKNDYRLATLK